MAPSKRHYQQWVVRHFTHLGWFLLCPVYVNARTSEFVERAFVPGHWVLLNVWVFDLFKLALRLFGIPPPAGFPVLILGRIPWRRRRSDR